MKTRAGFTLIELLVVISIITILMGILFPVFVSARDRGKQTVCLSNLRQLGMGIAMYMMDNDEMFPYNDWVGERDAITGKFDISNGALATYIRSESMYYCPSDRFGRLSGLSFEMNSKIMGRHDFILEDPSRTILLIEAGVDDGRFDIGGLTGNEPIPSLQDGWRSNEIPNPLNALHNNSTANVLYADGHARGMRQGQIKASMFEVIELTFGDGDK